MKLGATELRIKSPTEEELDSIRRRPVYIICDNILDTYNVGAIFRLADAAAVSGVYLIGQTAVPTDPQLGHKIHKASVGVWQWVPWQHAPTVSDAIVQIKNQISKIKDTNQNSKVKTQTLRVTRSTLHVIAIEQHKNSIPYTKVSYDFPLVLILGHETEGVSKEALEVADEIVEIPMFGVNKSMNVMVSLAIVLWCILDKTK